jgi:hypothetical protein
MVSDAEYDKVCASIDVKKRTGNSKMDSFFEFFFSADTGIWIHQHPEIDKIKSLWFRLITTSK